MSQTNIIKKVTSMKKISFLFVCVCIAISLFTSFGKHDFQEVKIVGTIIASGNEPFVYPVIKTEKGKNYTAECSKETKEELLRLQGKKNKICRDNTFFQFSKSRISSIKRWLF